jgi:two-component system sensor histidine kinase GlrK
MRLLGSRTILQLDVFGFVVVALPLIAALVTALMEVDHLVAQSRRAVFQSANTLQAGRLLVEQATEMARNAQQYLVLGDEALYRLYRDKRAEFEDTTRELARLDLASGQRQLLERLNGTERQLSQRLARYQQRAQSDPQTISPTQADFTEFARLARTMLLESGRVIEREVNGVRRAATTLERKLVLQAFAVIPLALVLGAVFAFLIARPLRQMEHAIRRLGRGEFSEPIALSGARDLEELGQRLEWMRKRLLALEQQKANFLRHASHELKTPLATIREGSQLLRERVVGGLNPQQAEIADMLNESSLRLQKLIEELLQFSVEPPPRPGAQVKQLELHRLVRRVLTDHKIAMTSRRLRITKDLEPVAVHGDAEKLRVVVDNLVSNAVKHSPRGGHIRIALGHRNGWAILDVQDQGPGVASAERERIFEPFYRGAAPGASAVAGTGLGLAIAREYVAMHEGTIQALATQRGAHLRVALPLAAAPAVPEPGRVPPGRAASC